MGIVEAVMDDAMDCISEYYEMVNDGENEYYVFRGGGDDEEEDGQPCSQKY